MFTQEQKNQIRGLIEERGIREVLHFTRKCNLQSIMEHGLLSNSEYRRIESDGNRIQNDQWSETSEHISCSIGFPNYGLFYKFRIPNKGESVPWCVISIAPEVLYKEFCLFCVTNSATGRGSSEKKNVFNIARQNNNNRNPLICLFEETYIRNGDRVERSSLGIPSYYTTDPQAEILIPGQIKWRYICNIYLDTPVDPEENKLYDGKLVHCQKYFSPREDFERWQRS